MKVYQNSQPRGVRHEVADSCLSLAPVYSLASYTYTRARSETQNQRHTIKDIIKDTPRHTRTYSQKVTDTAAGTPTGMGARTVCFSGWAESGGRLRLWRIGPGVMYDLTLVICHGCVTVYRAERIG